MSSGTGRRSCVGVYTPNLPDPTRERTLFTDSEIRIYGWPSKGGVIVLEHVGIVDFDSLGLSHLNPTLSRSEDQEVEDTFCQRLLLLGAKWWSSVNRRDLFYAVATDDEFAIERMKKEPMPTSNTQERLWISVGWPTSGGLWVAEFETETLGMERRDDLPPGELAWLKLARNMNERCQLLETEFRGKFYKSLEEYDGFGCLKAWVDGIETDGFDQYQQHKETNDALDCFFVE
jgi:hypothetical protein